MRAPRAVIFPMPGRWWTAPERPGLAHARHAGRISFRTRRRTIRPAHDPRLRHESGIARYLALAEMEVMAQGVNVARGGTVTSLDTFESGGWARRNLVDGRTGFVKGEEVGPAGVGFS